MSDNHAESNAPVSFDDVLLTTKEAAAYLTVSPSTLAYWRAVGNGPRYARLGVRTIRSRPSDVVAYGTTYWPNGSRYGANS
jgi:hypothetical protein